MQPPIIRTLSLRELYGLSPKLSTPIAAKGMLVPAPAVQTLAVKGATTVKITDGEILFFTAVALIAVLISVNSYDFNKEQKEKPKYAKPYIYKHQLPSTFN
jgi:hypothetical protein